MSELPAVSARDAIRALEAVGFAVDRMHGSHYIMKKPGHVFLVTVPMHGKKSLKTGTLRRIIRDAGLTVDEFVAALNR